MKKIYIIFGIIAILAILILGVIKYIYSDNLKLYKLQKKILSPVSMINYYTDKKFSKKTIIENIKYEKDIFDSETMWAKILVPTEEIDINFEKETRFYFEDQKEIELLGYEGIDFSYRRYGNGNKGDTEKMRTLNIFVMQPEGEYTRVYIYINQLGCPGSEWMGIIDLRYFD